MAAEKSTGGPVQDGNMTGAELRRKHWDAMKRHEATLIAEWQSQIADQKSLQPKLGGFPSSVGAATNTTPTKKST